MTEGPLAGVRVVEFDAIGPVPLAAMMLADMGCEVVRIARPSGRTWDETGGAVLNRGRPVVHLDLKVEADRASTLALVARADAVIEGFRPGVMERLGLGPDVCLEANPRLVFARMTGWGQTGPLAQRAGHDINYIAVTGALNAIGPADRPPPPPLNLLGDYGGGAMFAVVGLLAAIINARTTGKGQVVDVAMTDGVAVLTSFFHAFAHRGLWRDERGANLLDGGAPFYRCYACADDRFVAVGALEPQFFAQLLAGLEIAPDVFDQYDMTVWPRMQAVLAERFQARTRDEWAATFADTDACVSPVLSFGEAPDYPHNRARGTFMTRADVVQPSPAPRFGATPSEIGKAEDDLTVANMLERWA